MKSYHAVSLTLCVILFLSINFSGHSQRIPIGFGQIEQTPGSPLEAQIGVTYTYTYEYPMLMGSYWTINGLNLGEGSQISHQYYSTGNYTVSLRGPSGEITATLIVTVVGNPVPTPSKPQIYEVNCGNTVLKRGNPPIGVNWFWQTSQWNTSTSNSSKYYTKTNNGRVYLRARDNSGSWSDPIASNYISIEKKPNKYDVLGGFTLCEPSDEPRVIGIRLSDSEYFTEYQLRKDGQDFGTPQSGTGDPIFFMPFDREWETGVYTVVATNLSNECTEVMNGSAVIDMDGPEVFQVTGGGAYCSGDEGVAIGLSGSQLEINYQLRRDGVNIAIQQGTGNSLDFGVHSTSGTYTIHAVKGNSSLSQCEVQMSEEAVVVEDFGPAQPTISSITYDFNGATVTRNDPPNGAIWYWHTWVHGESQSNSSPTYLMTEDKNYYIRGISNNGCWGENLVISYRAKEPDVITANTESYNSIKVTWSGVKGNETGFLISRSNEENGTYVPIHTASSSDSEYIDSDLEINSTWYYRVQAIVDEQKSTGLRVVSGATESLSYIPDQEFWRRIVIQYPETKIVDNGVSLVNYIKTSYAEQITYLNCARVFDYEAKINDITGIEAFKALEGFNFHRHNISRANLSENQNIRSVHFPDNPNLLCIKISVNQLNDPNISWNIGSFTSLTTEDCNDLPKTAIPDGQFETILIDEGYDNILDGWVNTDKIENVTSLDILFDSHVSDLTGIEDFISLQELEINDSRSSITRLNLSNNSNLNSVRVFSRTLDCITVSEEQFSDPDIFWQTNKWIAISTTMCDQQTHIPAYQFRKALYDEEWAIYDGSEYVSTAVVSLIKNLDLSDYSINNLKGIEDFTSLEILKCSGCPLSNDSRNSVENLPNLKYLDLSLANLDQLDISNLQMLDELYVTENKWLTCIQVNDAQINDLELIIEKDLHAGLSLDCSNQKLTYIPGNNFEVALTELGYDNKIDDYIVTDVIDDITHLNISDKFIYDLTGIQEFVSLTNLYCNNNWIASLDLSNNLNLKNASVYGNNGLTCIRVNQDQVEAVSWVKDSFTGLATEICEDIYIPDNNFEQKLIELGYDNDIDDYVSLSTIKNVTSLNLYSEQIESLQGIESFESLEYLNCSNNYLTELNLSQNTTLTNVLAHFNPYLNCIQVNEDQLDHMVSSWYKDENAEWSLDCSMASPSSARASEENEESSEDIILSEASMNIELTLYPNPANEEIHLIGNILGAVVHIYDLNGKEVLHEANDQDTSLNLNSSSLDDGVYLMRIELTTGEVEERKLVIKH